MKLLYLTPTYNSYSEVWQQRHIEMLKDYIFCIASPSPNERMWRNKIPLVDLNPENKLKTKVLKYVTKKNNNKQQLENQVKSLVKKADIIFIQYLTFAVELSKVLNASKKPIFVHTHGFDITWDLRFHDNPRKRVHSEAYVESIKSFNSNIYFIANSQDSKMKLLELNIPESNIYLKYLGTEIPPLNADKTKDFKAKFNLLFLGRLVDFKGPNLVIEAFNLACKKGFKGNLLIAGDGALKSMCELMKVKSDYGDRIQLLGPVSKSKAEELRNKSHVFIAHNCKGPISNQEEAFGVSIIEAMAAQLPIITGANAGVKETVIHNKTGFLHEPFDVEKQAEYILRLYNNPDELKTMGRAGLERVKEKFSYKLEKETFLNILGLEDI